MKEIIKVEIKRILGAKLFIIMMVFVLIMSIISSIKSYESYNVYDQYGNIIISSKDNLKESKLAKHNTVLNEETIKSIVMQEDTTKFSYNLKLTTLIASNYSKKVVDLTDQDIADFYNQRARNVAVNVRFRGTDEEWAIKSQGLNPLTTPIKIGYAEGWLNLNNDMIDFTTLLIYLIPFLILFVFGQTSKVNMKQLYSSTKYGQGYYIKAKLITAFGVGAVLYFISIGIFSIINLATLGFQGGNLQIQNNMRYLFCPYNLTYIQQYLINVTVGFMALLLLISLTLLITVVVKQILSSAVVLTLFLLIMPMLPNNNYLFNYRFKNFLPYYMTNFDELYAHPYIYDIFYKILPSFAVVSLVALLICIIFTTVALVVIRKEMIE